MRKWDSATAPAGRAGTSNARRCARRCSASTSTSTAAAWTCSSRTTRTRSRRAKAANGGPFVNYWVHNGLLTVDNEKMSKSLGNFFTIRDVLKHYDGETLRFFMLRAHYRSPLNFSDANLDDARNALRRLYTALDGVDVDAASRSTGARRAPAAFRAAMNDDFNTPLAVAVLFELASEVNRTRSRRRLGALAEGAGRDARPAAAGAARLSARRAARSTRTTHRRAHRGACRRQAGARLRTRRPHPRGAGRARASCCRTRPHGTTWMKA